MGRLPSLTQEEADSKTLKELFDLIEVALKIYEPDDEKLAEEVYDHLCICRKAIKKHEVIPDCRKWAAKAKSLCDTYIGGFGFRMGSIGNLLGELRSYLLGEKY